MVTRRFESFLVDRNKYYKYEVISGMEKIIKFYATWCGPCKISKPTHEKVAASADLPLQEIDIDNDPAGLTQLYKVKSVPTVIRINKNGDEIARSIGAKTFEMTKNDLGL